MAKLRRSGPKLSVADIRSFEREFGLTLPPSYRKLMMAQNGGLPERTLYPNGRTSVAEVDLVYQLGSRQMRDAAAIVECVEDGFLPVAGSSGGDHLLMDLATGAVFLWDHERVSDTFDRSELLFLENSLEAVLIKLGGDVLGVDPDEIERLGANGTADELEAYVKAGGRMDATNNRGLTIAQIAAGHGNLAVLKSCVAHGAELDGAMALAAAGEQEAVIRYLLQQGRDINERRKGRTPLCFAGHTSQAFYAFLVGLGAVSIDEREQ